MERVSYAPEYSHIFCHTLETLRPGLSQVFFGNLLREKKSSVLTENDSGQGDAPIPTTHTHTEFFASTTAEIIPMPSSTRTSIEIPATLDVEAGRPTELLPTPPTAPVPPQTTDGC